MSGVPLARYERMQLAQARNTATKLQWLQSIVNQDPNESS
jgi:hypothetical protein